MLTSLPAMYEYLFGSDVEPASCQQRNAEIIVHPNFGSAQVLSTVSFCTLDDVQAWAKASPHLDGMLKTDCVWRHLIASHYRAALDCFKGMSSSEETAEAMLCLIPDGKVATQYHKLHMISTEPFRIDKRARLVLEIHELKDWDQRQKYFFLHRQANILAAAMHRGEESNRLRLWIGTNALEMMSLMALIGPDKVPKLSEIPEALFGPDADQEVQTILQRRMKKRREWWQKQREFLLEDLNWH